MKNLGDLPQNKKKPFIKNKTIKASTLLRPDNLFSGNRPSLYKGIPQSINEIENLESPLYRITTNIKIVRKSIYKSNYCAK